MQLMSAEFNSKANIFDTYSISSSIVAFQPSFSREHKLYLLLGHDYGQGTKS